MQCEPPAEAGTELKAYSQTELVYGVHILPYPIERDPSPFQWRLQKAQKTATQLFWAILC